VSIQLYLDCRVWICCTIASSFFMWLDLLRHPAELDMILIAPNAIQVTADVDVPLIARQADQAI